MTKSQPRADAVSVIIRSYDRPAALVELLTAVLGQRHPSFEVVIVDQTPPGRTNDLDAARLDVLARDPRVRRLRFPPLGGARARNEGARAARHDVLLFMDDDDLPAGDDWIAAHAAGYEDPSCLAITGRSVSADGREPSRAYLWRARRQVLSLVPLVMWQRVFVRADQRRRVDSVHGGNTSVRREALERAGLWDECTTVEDELSFNYRLRARMRPGEYLLFEPAARMIRRVDIPGGLDKRRRTIADYGRRVFDFQHDVVAHYFPTRFALAYPAFAAWTMLVCLEWLWENDNARYRGIGRKLAASAKFVASFPTLWTRWTAALVRRRRASGPPAHEPRLDETPRVPVRKTGS
jgi:glycosyltransferase involved in cell wall biosynthesis